MRLQTYLHPLDNSDYSSLMKLWETAGKIQVRESDTPEALARFLQRNPACNFAAYAGDRLVGAVLAGHDGWRGYLYHMAVAPDYREKGVGATLVGAAVSAIRKNGIEKIHCLVKCDNLVAQQFWEACGFVRRDELLDYSL